MPATLPSDLPTYVAWRFDAVLPGTFKRAKADFAHLDYPILAPLPGKGRNTPALQPSAHDGPSIYFVCDDAGRVRYVGKSQEDEVIHRWVRPGIGGPAQHYWTHSTKSGGTVFNIARGISSGASKHYELRYMRMKELSGEQAARMHLLDVVDGKRRLAAAEQALIEQLAPDWNKR